MQQINQLNLEQKIGLKQMVMQRVTYNTNSQIKCKTSMLKSSLCNYSYAYLLKEP